MVRLATGCAAALVMAGAAAAEPTFHARYQDWAVFTDETDRGRVCYALAGPEDASPRSVDHGEAAFMVATWRGGAAREQPSFIVGYPMRQIGPVRASIGRAETRMFVDGREAFVEETAAERSLVRAMRQGYTMRVEAVTQSGERTAYEFSLRGVTRALQGVASLCG